MSVIKKVDVEQSEAIEWSELNEHELKIVKLYRLLDNEQKSDILRFISVLLNMF
ncbi:hypothetical protein A7J50_1724 [Pseudomonas antarctica]|uniref:Uncharacterized protein n=1 Tax=Pseudomonas antarctica TaxID=219572 RepID=A0A172YY39_9PSED|nr:hypothetical protein A7J50_1724 [Pseudomonas antarctica]